MSATLDFQGDPAMIKAQPKLFCIAACPSFRSREAAVAACIEEINNAIERTRHARQVSQNEGYGTILQFD
jgi:hypothetical protein